MRTGLASRVSSGTVDVSLRSIVDSLHVSYPRGLRDLVSVLEPITIRHSLNAATCSGSCELTVTNDGVIRYSGHVHDSGALPASFAAITSFPTLTDRTTYSPEVSALVGALGPVVITHRGHVGGTLSFDARDESWDNTTTDLRIAENWAGVKAAAVSARTDFGTNTGAIEVFDALVAAGAGAFVFHL